MKAKVIDLSNSKAKTRREALNELSAALGLPPVEGDEAWLDSPIGSDAPTPPPKKSQ